MLPRLWSGAALLYGWLGAVVLVGVAQLLSYVLMPRAWQFFWLIPVDWASPLAMLGVLGSAWRALWTQRPFEAFSVTIVLPLLVFTVVWLGVRLWFAAQHAVIARRAA